MKPDIFQHAVFNAPDLSGNFIAAQFYCRILNSTDCCGGIVNSAKRGAKKREWTLPPSFFTVHFFTAVFGVTFAVLPATFCCVSLILLSTLSLGLMGAGGIGGLTITFVITLFLKISAPKI